MSYQSHELNGDYNLSYLNGNPTDLSESHIERFLNDQIRVLSHASVNETQENLCNSGKTCKDCDRSSVHSHQRSNKLKTIDRGKKMIGEKSSVNNSIADMHSENDDVSSVSSFTISQFDENDAKTFRQEDYSSDRVIDTLKEKYVCLNFEFNQLQEHHGEYVKNTASQQNDKDETVYSDSSENPLERKYTQVFRHREIPEKELPTIRKASKRHKTRQQEDSRSENKENLTRSHDNNKELRLILKTLKKIFRTPIAASRDTEELRKLYEVVKSLQEEQEKFRNIIKEQQDQINGLHSKHLQAQTIIQSQKYQIKRLSTTNNQLENEITTNINILKEKFQEKISEVSHLPRAVKSEKIKAEQLSRENCALITKLQQLKQELAQARAKLEEAGQKRVKTLNKLKNAERDLKIFRNQNNILKTEKRTLYDEIKKLKCVNDTLKTSSSKNITRQKERGDSEQRLLRKKIIDLEIELNQSRNSTTVLLEERDKLIAELHMQLNTLVHNFEVSQKHIRILRRHIYSLSGNHINPEKIS